MNQCLLEVEVLEAPKIRYTQDNQTPIAEMSVRLEGLRPEDPAGELKVVGFGSLAQDLQNRVVVGQRLVVEGRLRMNTVARPDGLKEKKVEFTLSRLHPLGSPSVSSAASPSPAAAIPAAPIPVSAPAKVTTPAARPSDAPSWNTGPLVDLPEDEIPF
ncbi:single-stranded DNA-binding protein [Synechococcus sp. UW140]|uniref:single-stranded DNA-binding protein n=1 Tax=Synechococcus sp. UW140 TaxID=368503 RepID=UPI0025E4E006|nr:single-stranded DNA-binding protein [Synechococcus sp. UW140]